MKDQGEKFLAKVSEEFIWEKVKEIPEIKEFFKRIEKLEHKIKELEENFQPIKTCHCCLENPQILVYVQTLTVTGGFLGACRA